MSDHIVKSYDDEISSLKNLLAEMGGLAEEQLDNAITALSKRDTVLADQVIARDEKLDRLEREIEEKSILTIAAARDKSLRSRIWKRLASKGASAGPPSNNGGSVARR